MNTSIEVSEKAAKIILFAGTVLILIICVIAVAFGDLSGIYSSF